MGDGFAGIVGQQLHVVPCQHGVAAVDIAVIAQHRYGHLGAAAGAEMPLQETDPQHHLGDDGGAGIDLYPQELFGRHRVALKFKPGGLVVQRGKHVDHLAFQPLHVFEGDV